MDGTKYVENTTRNVMYVGGKMILPGEGRDIALSLLPAELQDPTPALAALAAPSLVDLLAPLLAKPVKAIAAELPTLKNEALDLLAELEGQQLTPRTSLLAAVRSEQLKRAGARLDGPSEEDKDKAKEQAFEQAVQAAYQKQLAELTPEQLAAVEADPAAQAALMEQAVLDVQADQAHAG
jgi:hypothetical protein